MITRRYLERKISAQSCSLSGMDRAASRTMVPPILHSQNRHPHRRYRGRFAVLDPARSMPGAPSYLSGSGGQNANSTAYRRASGRTRMERRPGRNTSDQGRTQGRAGRTGSPEAGGLITGSGRHRKVPPRFPDDRARSIGGAGDRMWTGNRVRQDKRNGAIPSGYHAITLCLHIVFSCIRHGATSGGMAPYFRQHAELVRCSLALWPSCSLLASRCVRHG